MKANELRIGNLVTFNGKQIIVSWEDVQFIMTSDFEKEYHKPIPLTEEWLLKFGFSTVGGEFYLQVDNDLEIAIEFWDKTVYHNSHYISTVKYVHKLQNLYFALVGEELKIKE